MPQDQPKNHRFLAAALAGVLAVIFVDQYTKWLVLETVLRAGAEGADFTTWFTTARHWSDHGDEYVNKTLNSILNIVMVWNRGISFGMLDVSNAPPPAVFIGLSLVIVGLLLTWMFFVRRNLVTFASSLIVGGAIGNVIDRVRFGAVADFLDFHLNEKHWPSFNVADSCIVVGAAILMADALLTKDDKVPAAGATKS